MAASRHDLLAWINDLLQLNVTKVEHCGTGAVYCQIFDSIYRDVPMSKVKFDASTEYSYEANLKILQTCFVKHQIDRTIEIKALAKCKMQDNLEFLQFLKRYWDDNRQSDEGYDAIARRKGSGPAPASRPTATAPARTAGAGAARRGTTPTTTPAARTASRTVGGGGGVASSALVRENTSLKETVTGLERERDFYFSKLRDIELLLQQAVEADPTLDEDENGIIKHIQTILYSTEEGFEIPAEGEGDVAAQDDLETF